MIVWRGVVRIVITGDNMDVEPGRPPLQTLNAGSNVEVHPT